MAEPVDFFADAASLAVTPNGWTLTLMRSVPLPVGQAAGVITEENKEVPAEIVARVRFNANMAAALRDVLDRVISQRAEALEQSPHEPASLPVSSAGTPSI